MDPARQAKSGGGMLELKPEGLNLADAVSQQVSVCGRQLIADNSGALYWPSQSTLLVADLDLDQNDPSEYGAPMLSATRRTLTRLAEVMDRYEPARVIALGVCARSDAPARISAEDLEVLCILQEGREWVWVTGRDDAEIALQIGGRACRELEISGIALRPEPAASWTTHEIGAHLRPAARLSIYGYSIRRACFVGNGRRLVMPAFGAPAGGLNVLDPAFHALFGSGGMAVWMLGEEGLYPVAPRFLAGD
jgi:metallophosphoesterase superfamily enzyme